MIPIVAPPNNLIEITEPKMCLEGKRVPYGRLSQRFKKRWYLDMSVGRVFFRRLGQLGRDEANTEYALAHPEFAQLVQDNEILREFYAKGVPLDKPHMALLESMNRALIPVRKLHASKCIVDYDEQGKEHPAFESMDDYDAFLSALQPEEVDQLYTIVNELASTEPITEESHAMLALAKEYNIPLADGLTLENMSAEIADALAENVTLQSEANAREITRLKG